MELTKQIHIFQIPLHRVIANTNMNWIRKEGDYRLVFIIHKINSSHTTYAYVESMLNYCIDVDVNTHAFAAYLSCNNESHPTATLSTEM